MLSTLLREQSLSVCTAYTALSFIYTLMVIECGRNYRGITISLDGGYVEENG
jgi:hypothetical protein